MSEPIVFAYLDEPPFCGPGADGSAEGCDVSLLSLALKELRVGAVEMRLVSFAELLPGLVDGRWTITTPLFISAERQALVDFSRPVWALSDGLLVRKGDESRLSSYGAVAGAESSRLVVVADQVQERTGLTAGVPPGRVLRVATQREAVDAVRHGQADAYASVAMAHHGFLTREPDPNLAVVSLAGRSPAAQGAFAIAKSASDFRARLDEVLDVLIGSDWHRRLMSRYGFSPEEYDPAVLARNDR